MRIGITAFPTPTGLGYQTKSYVKHFSPDKVMEINLTGYNGMPYIDWFSGSQKVVGYPKEQDIVNFLDGLDIVLFAETPLNYEFYRLARERGVKTAVVVNWEFFDHIAKPELPLPDLFIMPSVWHLEDMQQFGAEHNIPVVQIHHPVDRDEIEYRPRTQLSNFLHIAGNPAIHDRNGTDIYLQAEPSGTIATQNSDMARVLANQYRHSTIYTDIESQNHLYALGDVLVLPRRYGGNCLPMNEALAAGMPVIMPDISPNNNLLPPEWLVPALITDRFTPRTTIDIYTIDYEALRQKLDWFRNCDLEFESRRANQIADTISWEVLKPKYIEALEGIL